MIWDVTKALPEISQPAVGPETRGFHLNDHSGLTNAPGGDAAATVRFRSPRGVRQWHNVSLTSQLDRRERLNLLGRTALMLIDCGRPSGSRARRWCSNRSHINQQKYWKWEQTGACRRPFVMHGAISSWVSCVGNI